MRTIHVRSLSIGAFALLAFAGSAAAQTPPSAVLNTLEVRKLVASAEPGDHARLSAHFAALADEYTTTARRHTAMSRAFDGNPNRQSATGMRDHARRLAELDAKSAATLRELAAHHDALAAGKPSNVPGGAARFEGGAGAPEPTEQELSALAAKASTPADHRGLEEYFLTLARRYTADAERHALMAATYRGTRIAMAADHCERLVALSRDSAKEASAAAALHASLAGVAR